MITMKTIYILAAFLGLQYNTIFAAVHFSESPGLSKEIMAVVSSAMLTPETPSEATFDDATEMNETGITPWAITPVIPMIADFNDAAPVTEISQLNLAPVTPKEADFEDETGTAITPPVRDLAPVAPADADFTDNV